MNNKQRNGIFRPRIFTSSVASLILLSLCASVSASPLHSVGSGQSVEGTWKVQVSVEDPPPGFPVPFTALETYSRGGGMVTSNNNPLIPRPGQGTWKKIGDQYLVTIVFFLFDQTGSPIGTVEVTHVVVLEGGDQYQGQGQAEFKDNNGDPLFLSHPEPFSFTAVGTRVGS